MANEPVAFAAVLAGGWLLDRGAKNLKTAFSSTPAATGTGGATGTSPAIGPHLTGKAGATAMLAAAQVAAKSNIAWSTSVSGSGLLAGFRTDCSGFVSWLISHADPHFGDQTTVTIPDQPGVQAGRGSLVTIWDRPQAGQQGHVIINILGHWFESGGQAGIAGTEPHGSGVIEMTAAQVASELGSIAGNSTANGFQAFHLVGM